MKKMLQISSVALLVSFISFPGNVFGQSGSGSTEGFAFSESTMGIAGIVIVLAAALVFSVIGNNNEVSQA
jgi:hypothetical protein